MQKVMIITGGSSGIGLATAAEMQKAGFRVYEFSRRDVEHTGVICHVMADVTDPVAVQQAVDFVINREGRIDLLICNAGFGISGAAEFTENADAKKLLEVNLFGAVNTVKAVLPIMRQQGSGRILFISSVAAPIAIPFQSWYSVSKAAVSAYAAALREEIRPFGIEVCVILPGDIQTGFTAAREKNHAGDEIYSGRISRSVAVMEHDEENGITPQKAAERIRRIALKRHLRPNYAIGFSYSCILILARLLPNRLLSWIVGKIYAK